jgi:glyoxylase-like metal-dependent hydrolase (beta-lactamase superfamily II)
MNPEQQTPVPSPCINICRMVPATGLCEGCMRTIDEIVAWGRADDAINAARVGRDPAPRSADRLRLMRLPASMQVFERGWLSANNILFIGRDATTLVDTGYVTHAPQTLALVGHALEGRPLDRIVNTHLHSDHCGGNAILKEAFGCRIAIPVFEADKVRAWDEEALSYRATGQQCPRFSFDDTIAPGDMTERWATWTGRPWLRRATIRMRCCSGARRRAS